MRVVKIYLQMLQIVLSTNAAIRIAGCCTAYCRSRSKTSPIHRRQLYGPTFTSSLLTLSTCPQHLHNPPSPPIQPVGANTEGELIPDLNGSRIQSLDLVLRKCCELLHCFNEGGQRSRGGKMHLAGLRGLSGVRG